MSGVVHVDMEVLMPHRKASLEPELHEHSSVGGVLLGKRAMWMERDGARPEAGEMRVIVPVLPGTRSFIYSNEVLPSGADKRTARVSVGAVGEQKIRSLKV